MPHLLLSVFTHAHETKGHSTERMLDASVEPSMISTRTQSDEIFLMLDVLDLLRNQSGIFFDVITDAAILGLGRTI